MEDQIMEEIYNTIVAILELAQKMKKDYEKSKGLVPKNIVELASLEENITPLIKRINEEKVQESWSVITYRTQYILVAKNLEACESRDMRFKYISTVREEAAKIKKHLLKYMSPDIRFDEVLDTIVRMNASYPEDISGGLLSPKELFILYSEISLKDCYNELISIFQQITEEGELKEQVYQIGLIIDKFLETKHPEEKEALECRRCIEEIQILAQRFKENKNVGCLR